MKIITFYFLWEQVDFQAKQSQNMLVLKIWLQLLILLHNLRAILQKEVIHCLYSDLT